MSIDLSGKVEISDNILVSIPIETTSYVNINDNVNISNNIEFKLPVYFENDIILPSGQIINSTHNLVDTSLQQTISNKTFQSVTLDNPTIKKLTLIFNVQSFINSYNLSFFVRKL